MLTFSAGAVLIVFVKTLLNGVTAHGITFGTVDPALIGALLVPTLGAYTAKRIKVDKEQQA